MTSGMPIHEHYKRRMWSVAALCLFILLFVSLRWNGVPGSGGARSVPVRLGNAALHLPQHVSFERHAGQQYDHLETNGTFGFERVYLINQARRRDRLTEMQLLLNQYNIPYTVVKAIDGAKEMPNASGEEQRLHSKSQSHAVIWQKMLTHNVKSALIVEDTFDMDRRIHEQMQRLQAPFAAMLNIAHDGQNQTSLKSGDHWNTALWDLLWFGQCSEQAWTPTSLSQTPAVLPNLRGAPYLTYRDPTRSRVAHHQEVFSAYGIAANDEKEASEKRLRIIQPALAPHCTTAYAITKHGAARALYQAAHKTKIRDLDEDLRELLSQGRLRAYTVIPSLFARRRGRDDSTNDGALIEGDSEWHNIPVPGAGGKTHGIDFSARQHLFADLLGEDRVLVRQKSFVEKEMAEKQQQGQ